MNAPPRASQALKRWVQHAGQSRWAIIITVLVWLMLNAPALLTYPSISSDEGLFSAVAWNFYTHGSFNSPIFGPIEHGRLTPIYHGRLYEVLLGLHFWLFGVGVMQARLSSLLGALLGGVLAGQVARQLGMGQGARWVAITIFLLSWRTFLAGHRARPDIWMAASCLLMFCMFLRIRAAPTPKGFFILGVICSYLIDLHVPVVSYTLGTSLLVGLDFMRRRISWQSIAGYGGGLLTGLAVWLVLWLLPEPVQALSIWVGEKGRAQPLVGMAVHYDIGNQLRQALGWFEAVFIQGTRLSGVETALTLAAVLLLAHRRSAADRMVLAWSGLTVVAFILVPYKPSWHAVMLLPFVSLIMARASEGVLAVNPGPIGLASRRWAGQLAGTFARIPAGAGLTDRRCGASGNKRQLSVPATLGSLALIALYVAGDISLAWRSREPLYANYAAALRQLVPYHSNVMAESNWWYVFYDGIFTSDLAARDRWGINRASLSPEAAAAQIMTERRIAYVLVDESLSSGWQEPLDADESVIYNAYRKMLRASCTPVGKVALPYYGIDQGGPGVKETVIWKCR